MIINFKGEYKFQETLLQLKFLTNLVRTKWTLDNVQEAHGFNGHCPVCLDIVQSISGQSPDFQLSPWIMSIESMDAWTLSRLQVDTGQC